MCDNKHYRLYHIKCCDSSLKYKSQKDDGIGDVMAEGKKLVIRKKGEDGTKTFSVRLKEETIRRIDELAMKTDRSRNELIGMLLEFGLDNCETE